MLKRLITHYVPGITVLLASTVVGADFEVRPGFTLVDSVAQLRESMARSNQKIRLKPGTYRIESTATDNKAVFIISGSDNHFDLRGVRLQIDTQVLADLRGSEHSLCAYGVLGDRVTFEGAVFEDMGDHPPFRSLSEFAVRGNNVVFQDCTFIIRGSAPYGYGDLFGKGAGAKVRLQKHAAMSVSGDNTRVLGCRFFIHTFGHAIHIHGAQDTLVRDTAIEGALRLSDEILAEREGPAARFGYRDLYNRPIPKGTMICLAEDGIRAYLDGGRERPQPRTGDITVIDCTVKRMRGGITLALASGSVAVRGCTVTESGYPGCAYALPSRAVVRDCKGDAAYAPLLHLGYSHQRDTDIELEVIEAEHYLGNDLLALINGHGHRIKLLKPDGKPLMENPKIICGQTYRADKADVGETFCRNLQLTNFTRQPVLLSELASGCRMISAGTVQDYGTDNTVDLLENVPQRDGEQPTQGDAGQAGAH